MKKLIYFSFFTFLLTACTQKNISEKDLIGEWSRPIEMGMSMDVTYADGTKQTLGSGPVSDETLTLFAENTYIHTEEVRNSSDVYFTYIGDWSFNQDNNNIQLIRDNGHVSYLPIVKLTEDELHILATDNKTSIVMNRVY